MKMRRASLNRRTSPRVLGGIVQKKHNHTLTGTYWNTPQTYPAIDKERPGPGHRHYLGKRHITQFIELLPDWTELSKGLDAVVLSSASDCEGWYDRGVVGICAWPKDPWYLVEASYYQEHSEIFARLGIRCERKGKRHLCKFSDSTVRAYQLLHIFLHELGHHHDRMSTRRKRGGGGGESYAEEYAIRYEKVIWSRYADLFGFE